MKKILIIVMFLMVGTVGTLSAQEITAIDVDSLVLLKYNSYRPKLEAMEKEYPTIADQKSKDKLAAKYDKMQAKCDGDLIKIYTKYIEVEGVTQRLFTLRTSMSKKSLAKICNKIDEEKRKTDPYVKGLEMHINGYQVAVGDTIGDFTAITSKGYVFNYSEFRNEKDVLLVFGDIETMPLDVRMVLQVMYKEVDLAKMEIVSFMSAKSAEEMAIKAYNTQVDWMVVSDFRGELSPLRIAFGITVDPTVVYISKGGAITIMERGLSDATIEKIKQNSYSGVLKNSL